MLIVEYTSRWWIFVWSSWLREASNGCMSYVERFDLIFRLNGHIVGTLLPGSPMITVTSTSDQECGSGCIWFWCHLSDGSHISRRNFKNLSLRLNDPGIIIDCRIGAVKILFKLGRCTLSHASIFVGVLRDIQSEAFGRRNSHFQTWFLRQ